MTEILLVLLIGAGLFYVLFRGSIAKSDQHKARQSDWRKAVVQQLHLADHVQSDGYTLGLDKDHQRLAVVRPSGSGHWIPVECIRSVELKEHHSVFDESISRTSTNRGSQVTGALVGGAVAGPLGAVVGGLSGKTTTSTSGSSEAYVSSLELKLRLRNDALPNMTFRFSEGPSFDPATQSFSGGFQEIERFADRLTWELEKRSGESRVTGKECFEQIETLARPTNSEGWWTNTFGG